MRRAGSLGSHSALSSLLSPSAAAPFALPGHPPKIEKERKLFPQSAAARKSSPPVRGRAGFLELETNQSQARAAGPTAPGPLPSVCVISLIQQNTCPAVATLQAAEEGWGAPGLTLGCPQAPRAVRVGGT